MRRPLAIAIVSLALASPALAKPSKPTGAKVPPAVTATVAASPTAPKAPPGPWLHATVERARKLAERKVDPNSPAEAQWEKDVKAAIDDTVDWAELTQRSLGKAWEQRSEAERAEFSKLLRSVVELSYQSKLKIVAGDSGKKAAGVTLAWDAEKVEGSTATARATVKDGSDSYVLDFALKHDGAKWRVWDVSIDEASTVRNYRTQFTKIISEKGFPALLERLRKKVDEVKSGKGQLTP